MTRLPLPTLSRRSFLGASAGLLLSPRALATKRPLAEDPFTLGVASGYPIPDGVTLWTRLAPRPFAPMGGMDGQAVIVHWEMAHDEDFRQPIARGEASAEAAWGYSVHVDVRGLAAGRWYFYRFHVGGSTSAVGRTRTAPALTEVAPRLRMGLACCQHYEHGYFSAYRHLLADDPDLVVHVGDYIYEGSWGEQVVRRHTGRDPHTLEDYRARYACYRLDPDLQRMHGAAPWLTIWDDHEVENDYARDRSNYHDDRATFLARRAAAWQAFYEHLPLPASMRPTAEGMRIHTALSWGSLAQIALLDTRQYRSYPPCRTAEDKLGRPCRAFEDPAATMLGDDQEAWLEHALRTSPARWNLVAQQLSLARYDEVPGPGEKLHTQSWDAYPHARRRLLEVMAEKRVANPVVLGGDWHAFWANDLLHDFRTPDARPVAAEIVTTSLSALGPDESIVRAVRREAPWLKFGTARYRGYVRLEVTPERLDCDMRAVAEVTDSHSACLALSSWKVENGRPGIVRA